MTTPRFERVVDEPILTAADIPGANAVFNPAAVLTDEGIVLLARVEDRRGFSALYAARSSDGLTDWHVDDRPLLQPDAADPTSVWGFEDARTVWVEELDQFVITCTAYGPRGPCVYIATTRDFRDVERRGVALPPEDKNAALFPRRIRGKWLLLHRPVVAQTGAADIWVSSSKDLIGWAHSQVVLERRAAGWWDHQRIGAGPPPIETSAGWLLIYHGVRSTVGGVIYRAGAVLLDLDDPTVVLARHADWLLSPERPWERAGDVPNVVFPCGAVTVDGQLRLYYGSADTCIGVAACELEKLVASLTT